MAAFASSIESNGEAVEEIYHGGMPESEAIDD